MQALLHNSEAAVWRKRAEGFYESKPVKEPEEGEDLDTIEKVIQRQGVGVYKLNGNVYEGEWDQDKMHGHGEH